MSMGSRWTDTWQTEHMMLRAYIKNIETQLMHGLIGLVDPEEVVVEEGTPDEHERVIYDGIDDYDWDIDSIYNEYFPSLHRSAVLLTICSWFEITLNALCDGFQRETGNPLSVADMKGSGIYRAKKYLRIVGRLALDSDDHKRAWGQVTKIYEYRNAVAHVGGDLASLKEQERVEIQKALELDPTTLQLSPNSLAEALDAFYRVASTISKATREREKACD